MVKRFYPVYYNPETPLSESTNICKFCLRVVYFDSQHVNASGIDIPHDRSITTYKDPYDVEHHGSHCPDINGDAEARKYYAELRKKQGKPDPWLDWNKNKANDEQNNETDTDTEKIPGPEYNKDVINTINKMLIDMETKINLIDEDIKQTKASITTILSMLMSKIIDELQKAANDLEKHTEDLDQAAKNTSLDQFIKHDVMDEVKDL